MAACSLSVQDSPSISDESQSASPINQPISNQHPFNRPITNENDTSNDDPNKSCLSWLCSRFMPKLSIGLIPVPLATCYVLLTALVVWIYIMMRRITVSSEKFEAVPCYIITLQLLLCAGVMCLFNKESFRLHPTAIKFAAAIHGLATVLLVVAIVSSCWLAEKQERYNVCLFDTRMLRCACRKDERTKSETGWWIFDSVASCEVLDELYHWQIVTISVHSIAVFVCVVSVLFFYQIWLRTRHRRSSRPPHHLDRNGQEYPSLDWDAWLYSQSFLQRFVSELRHVRLPPSYDTSEQHAHPQVSHHVHRHPATPDTPPPAYHGHNPQSHSHTNNKDNGAVHPFVTVLQITAGDDHTIVIPK